MPWLHCNQSLREQSRESAQTQNADFLHRAAPRTTSAAIPSELGLLLLGFKQQLAASQAGRMLKQQLSLAMIHILENDDVFWVALTQR